MQSFQKPTFLCIGTQKAGTSWLYRMLKQHPEVHTSEPKELHYFNREPNYEKGLDWYLSHFPTGIEAKAYGEFTPDYLWVRTEHRDVPGFEATPDVPSRVAAVLPDVKLIAILRDPVTRAVSSYFHEIGAGRLDPNRRISEVGDEGGILSKGYYAQHLAKWFKHYSRDSFRILIYEQDLSRVQRLRALQSIFAHIGVEPGFVPAQIYQKYNSRRSHFDYRLSRLASGFQYLARRYTPKFVKASAYWEIPVSPNEVEALRQHYRYHNKAIEELLGQVLPWQS